MKTKTFALIAVIFCTFSVTGAANASSSITTFVNGQSGPWNSWPSVLPPTVVDSSTGLAMKAGDILSIHYVSGIVNGGGGGIYSDANGNPVDGDLFTGAGNPPTRNPIDFPSHFLSQSQGPVYFMALLGVFANSNGVLLGDPFKIGDGPFSVKIPDGASKLLMGFNDSRGGFVDNGGGTTMGITEIPAIPEPETYAMFIAGLGLMGFMARRRNTA